MKNFESFLSAQLNEYLLYRHNLGYSMKNLRSHLLAFDRYLIETNAQWESLNPFFFLEMRTNIQKTNPALSTPRERPDKSASIPMLPTAWMPKRYHVVTCTAISNIKKTRLNVRRLCTLIMHSFLPTTNAFNN